MKIVFWILIVVLIFAFGLWGVGSYRESLRQGKYAGEIFARKISIPEFHEMLIICDRDARARYGDQYNQISKYLNLNNEAWQRLILLEYAKKEKIKASDKEVIEKIKSEFTLGEDAEFDPVLYKRIVRQSLRMDPRKYEEQLRKRLTMVKVYEGQTKDIAVDDEELLKSYHEEFEQISVNYIKAASADFSQTIKIEEGQIKDYYEKNPEAFKRPPTVNVEYLVIEYPKDATDEDKEKINENMMYSYPRIKTAQDLSAVEKEPFIYKQTGFFAMGEPIKDIGFIPEFYQHAFELKEKETSPVIESYKGVYVLRVIEKKDTYIPEFQEVRDKAGEALKKEKAKEEAKKKCQEYKTKIDEALVKDKSQNLKTSAEALGLEPKTTPMFKRGGFVPEVGRGEEFYSQAFELKENQISGIIETDAGCFLIERDKFEGIDEEKLNNEKEEYHKKLLDQKKSQAFTEFVQELVKKANLKDYTQELNQAEAR